MRISPWARLQRVVLGKLRSREAYEVQKTCPGKKQTWWSTGRGWCNGVIADAAAKPEKRVSRLEGVCSHGLSWSRNGCLRGFLTSPQTSWRGLGRSLTPDLQSLFEPAFILPTLLEKILRFLYFVGLDFCAFSSCHMPTLANVQCTATKTTAAVPGWSQPLVWFQHRVSRRSK